MNSISTASAETMPPGQRAIAVLLADVEEAQRVAAALDEVRRPDGPLAVIAVPPVRALAFFADAERQDKLDRWWSHAIPRDCEPIYLLRHQEGVAAWLPGLDGQFVVGGVGPAEAAEYAGMHNVTTAPGTTSLDVVGALISAVSRLRLFRDDAAARMQYRLARPSPTAAGRFRRARLRPADEVFVSGVPVSPEAHPIPNLPERSPAATPAGGAARVAAADTGHAELVRALAETLHRLQKIRSGT